MSTMETIDQVVERMTAAGYRDHFRAEGERLHAKGANRSYAPETLVVDEVARFEGESDPGDEAAVFALRSLEDDLRGTYTVTYGPQMATADAKIVPRLRDAESR